MIKTEDGWGPSLQTREIRQEDIVLNDLEIKGGGGCNRYYRPTRELLV